MELNDEEYEINGTDQTFTFSEPESLNVIVPLTIIYVIIFMIGFFGNINTCNVIWRIRSMHTATNYYLFSLAISDLLFLVCGLPLEVYHLWKPQSYPLSEAVCIISGCISETSTNATVLTITAFTVERYIAICYPFKARVMSKLSRVVYFITLIWFCALCSAVPQALQFGVVIHNVEEQNISTCTIKGRGIHQAFVSSSFLFFIVPMSLISVLYVLIYLKLRSSLKNQQIHRVKKSSDDKNERLNGARRQREGASQKKVIKMLVAVALSFFVCWAPFHVQRLIAIYGKKIDHPTNTFYEVYIILTYVSGVLYFLSTAINPILYNIMSNKFRDAQKRASPMWCRRGGPRPERTYSAYLEARRERVAKRLAQQKRPPSPHYRCRLSTEPSQLREAPSRAQRLLPMWCRRSGPRPERTHSAYLEAQRERVGKRLAQKKRPPSPHYRRRLSTAPSQLREAPSRTQFYHQSSPDIINEMPDFRRVWKQDLPERSDSCISPRSISNSSLREVDQEMSTEELATYMYQVNCNISAIT